MSLDLKKAYAQAEARDDFWYNSETYQNAVTRYELYRNAYYRKHSTNDPVWKSKLFFPVYFMAVKAFDSEIRKSLQDPIVNVELKSRMGIDPALYEKEKLLNADLQNDLYISGYRKTLYDMYWFNGIFGTSVGRETMVRERSINKTKKAVIGRFGESKIVDNEELVISEHTDTDKIHPLNFAHALNRGEFYESAWASVRYELSISDLYGLLYHPLANVEGIKNIIAKIESGGGLGWTNGNNKYYVDNNDYKEGNQDTLIASEYSGNMQFAGNYGDNKLYWGVRSRDYQEWILFGESPYQRHPFWKMRTYPDPFGPFGVGPQAVLIPTNVLKNTLFNQYVDFTNANLKYLYQSFSPYVRGGMRTLIDGLPGGLVEAIDEIAWKNGELIKPIRKESGGIPGMADVFGILEKTEVESSISSSRKRAVEGITKTATGEMQIAEQQDAAIASVVEDLDFGLMDCIHQKISNRTRLIKAEQRAKLSPVAGESPDVLYFPFELGGEDFDVVVNRKSSMAESNKYMAWLTKVGEGMQIVQSGNGMLNPQAVMQIYDEIGRKIGLDNTDRVWNQQGGIPPELGNVPGQPEMAAAGMPGGAGTAQAAMV